jgi:outer membrane protein insertion porin family
MTNKLFLIFLFSLFISISFGQVGLNSDIDINYSTPKEYEIGGITVSGIKYLDESALISLSGLAIGDKIQIPGEEVTRAIEKLWKQGLFSDVKIKAVKIVGTTIFLNIYLQERPRLSKFAFRGVKKSEADDLREDLRLVKGMQVTDNIINTSKYRIKNYFVDKGYYNCQVDIVQKDDTTLLNNVVVVFDIKKKSKVKIKAIIIEGNDKTRMQKNLLFFEKEVPVVSSKKMKHLMKDTKEKYLSHIFKTSKFIESNYKTDKQKIITRYNSLGYRDATIVEDSVYGVNEQLLSIYMKIDEGKKYYFGNITWVGNSKYPSELLTRALEIKYGDIYNQELFDNRLFVDENSVSSIYLDNGYLFFSVTPVETSVNGDTIDIEMRVYEGKQARIKNVTIVGNTKTHEHVIRREIKTKPGQLFSRSDIIRTQRELAQLGYFNPEKLNVNPKPNPVDGTVDLEYIVEEKPSDQIELSGGWGAQMIVGTLGLSFNNFSLRNFFKSSAWQPLPAGDGQKLSLRAQTNGVYYQAYSFSFVEPWLGGKKPNSLTTTFYHNTYSNGIKVADPGRESMTITGVALGLGRRLKWPDDFFTLYNELSYQLYNLNNYNYQALFKFTDGIANNISFKTVLMRNSVDQPIYPRRGNMFSISLQLTPPYSLLNGKDYTSMTDKQRYEYVEYHKWKFNAAWYQSIVGDLVVTARAEMGILGIYNHNVGSSPFEGFNVGGDGLVSYNISGTETIALRGYANGSLTPAQGGNAYTKYTLELRYPLSLNPSATLYALAFLEAGNAWYEFSEINPFAAYRAAGVGVRIFLPMFGKLGVDWGYGFDPIYGNPTASGSQFHFIIGQNF